MPGETDKEFSKFLLYLNAGLKRTLKETEEASRGKQVKAGTSGNWAALCKRFRWVERASAYDKAEGLRIAELTKSDRELAAAIQDKGMKIASACVVRLLEEAERQGDNMMVAKLLTRAIRGGHTGLLLECHRTMFGEKHDVHTVKEEWKRIEFRKIE